MQQLSSAENNAIKDERVCRVTGTADCVNVKQVRLKWLHEHKMWWDQKTGKTVGEGFLGFLQKGTLTFAEKQYSDTDNGEDMPALSSESLS